MTAVQSSHLQASGRLLPRLIVPALCRGKPETVGIQEGHPWLARRHPLVIMRGWQWRCQHMVSPSRKDCVSVWAGRPQVADWCLRDALEHGPAFRQFLTPSGRVQANLGKSDALSSLRGCSAVQLFFDGLDCDPMSTYIIRHVRWQIGWAAL